MRTFIAIEIPEKIKREIEKIQNQLPEFDGKLTKRENLHLTLKFLGEVDEEKIEKVKEKLKEIKYKGFEAKLDKIGFLITGNHKFILMNLLHGFILQIVKNCKKKLMKRFHIHLLKKKDS